MAAAIHRGTPASTVTGPPPQTTATVLEFRCLFTHDLFKKQKKWHDGSLRFHTFNRRVMVYDDAKNLVGDLHYRQADEFTEGLEFQLDKPVRVVVEEPTGESKTDLTPLLQRPRSDGAAQASSPSSVREPARRLPRTLPRGKPKSIKELLGASQGLHGRALLPERSPYEQRQALTDTNPIEPPPKRQKLAPGKENGRPSHQKVPFAGRSQKQPNQPKRNSPKAPGAASSVGGASLNAIEVFDVSSSSEQEMRSRPARKPVNKTQTRQSKLDRPAGTDSYEVVVENERPDRLASEHESPRVKRKEPKRRSRKSKVSTGNEVESTSAPNSKTAPSRPCGPRSALSFGPSRPKRMLLYKALLPGPVNDDERDGQTVVRSRSESGTARGNSIGKGTETPPAVREDNLDDRFSQTLEQPLEGSSIPSASRTSQRSLTGLKKGRTSKSGCEAVHVRNESKSAASPTAAEADEVCLTIDSSPLFVPHAVSQTSSHVASQHFGTDDFVLPSPSKTQQSPLPGLESAGESEVVVDVQDSFSKARATTSSPQQLLKPTLKGSLSSVPVAEGEETRQAQSSELAKSAAARFGTPEQPLRSYSQSPEARHLRSPSSAGQSATAFPARRNIRRIRSEADADASSSGPIEPDTTSLVRSLQRTTSDPTAHTHNQTSDQSLDFTTSHSKRDEEEQQQVRSASPAVAAELTEEEEEEAEEEKEETGPWTSTEAFLLFDWWPAGKRRNKPDYGQIGPRPQPVKVLGVEALKYSAFGSAKFVSQR